MPDSLYVCLQGEDKIAAFTIDADTGRLAPRAEIPATGGPSVLAISPDRRVLYVGHRNVPAISSFRIQRSSGGLTLLGTVAPSHAPTFLAPDRTGKYLLSAYYQGGFAGVHRIAADGSVARTSRLAGNGHRRTRHTDRPVQQIRLRATHCPPQR